MSRKNWHEVAAALTDLAQRATLLADDLAYQLPDPFVRIGILPGRSGDAHPDNAAIVDTVADALIGKTGTTGLRETGGLRHLAEDNSGPIRICVHALVPDPEDEDLAAARARIAELEAQLDAGRGGDRS